MGLGSGADVDEIKKAYRKLSLKWHPDKNVGNPDASQIYMDLTKAYETLTGFEKKKGKRKWTQFEVTYVRDE